MSRHYRGYGVSYSGTEPCERTRGFAMLVVRCSVVFEWYAGTALVVLFGLLSPRRQVLAYRIQKLRIPHQDWYASRSHPQLAAKWRRTSRPKLDARQSSSHPRNSNVNRTPG